MDRGNNGSQWYSRLSESNRKWIDELKKNSLPCVFLEGHGNGQVLIYLVLVRDTASSSSAEPFGLLENPVMFGQHVNCQLVDSVDR